MTPPRLRPVLVPAALLALVLGLPATAQPPLPPPDKPEVAPPPNEKPEPGVNVLDKGPIHEAFAQPGSDVRGKDVVAPKAPPPPIPELPPDTKPDGDNVKWVAGYWLWDADRKDFTWVSGFWRNAPAGRDWQAGEWKKDKDGNYAYSPGFWRPTNMNSWRVDLPEPPKTVENGPSTPATDPNAIWVPGNWVFNNGQYAWRPGYWAQPNGDQVWQPGQYLTTPSGYCYVPGYWDYPLEDRGLLYAPVYFSSPLWQTPGWAYRPRFALGLGFGRGWGTGGLFSSLYIGPGFNNYYYGNYGFGGGSWLGVGSPHWGSPWLGFGSAMWGSPWLGIGSPFFSPVFGGSLWSLGGYGPYTPWYANQRGFANPLWRHYTWLNRGNPNWTQNVQNVYVNRALGVNTPGARAAAVSPQPGVGGAMGTAVRAATNASRPAVPAQSAPLVQPAAQVAKSIAANQAVQKTNSVNGVPGRGNGNGNGNGNDVRAGVGAAGPGVTIKPNQNAATAGSSPLHTGSNAKGAMQQLNGVNVVPNNASRPAVAAGNAIPQIQQINPGGSLNQGLRPGATVPGVIQNVPQNVPQIRSGTPGNAGAQLPAVGSNANTVPRIQSVPSGVGGNPIGNAGRPAIGAGAGGNPGGGGARVGPAGNAGRPAIGGVGGGGGGGRPAGGGGGGGGGGKGGKR